MTPDTGRGYGESWPDGLWVHSGILPPGAGEDVLHFRVAQDGRIVGQGAASNPPPALCWTGLSWLNLGPTSGISIAAFHPVNGTVYVSDITGVRIYGRDGVQVGMMPGYLGSQGIRWIDPDGTIHSGDSTYSGPPLWEWTQVGDIKIGQGGPDAPDEGVRLVGPDGVLRYINRDVARFIRVNAVGDLFAICYLRLNDGANVRVLCSRAELLAMPPVALGQPGPPIQEPPPVTIPNYRSVVERIRAKYPTPLGARHWEFLVELAQATGTLLYRKNSGTNILIPALGVRVNQNIIGRGTMGDAWADVLTDAENTAAPTWDAHAGASGEYVDVSSVVLPGDGVPPVTTPPPITPPPDLSDLDAIISARITAALAPIQHDLAALKADAQGQTDHSLTGKRVALRADNGKYVCADGNAGPDKPLLANRDGVGSWETFELEEVK